VSLWTLFRLTFFVFAIGVDPRFNYNFIDHPTKPFPLQDGLTYFISPLLTFVKDRFTFGSLSVLFDEVPQVDSDGGRIETTNCPLINSVGRVFVFTHTGNGI